MTPQVKFQIVEDNKERTPVKVKGKVLQFDTWLEADNAMNALQGLKKPVIIHRVNV